MNASGCSLCVKRLNLNALAWWKFNQSCVCLCVCRDTEKKKASWRRRKWTNKSKKGGGGMRDVSISSGFILSHMWGGASVYLFKGGIIIDIGFCFPLHVSPSLKNVRWRRRATQQFAAKRKPSNPPLHVPSHPILKLGDIVSFFLGTQSTEGKKKGRNEK